MPRKFNNKEVAEKFEHLFSKGWSLSEDKIYIQKTFVFLIIFCFCKKDRPDRKKAQRINVSGFQKP